MKLPAKKDGEDAKRWGVTSFPAFVLVDPSAEQPEKSVLDRVVGKKSAAALKLALQRALAKVEAKK